MPRTFQFNHVVALDTVFIQFQGTSYPYLNMVDHGSNLQVCVRMGEFSAAGAWRAFSTHWLQPFGAPHVVLTDGGSEFEERLAAGLEVGHLAPYDRCQLPVAKRPL